MHKQSAVVDDTHSARGILLSETTLPNEVVSYLVDLANTHTGQSVQFPFTTDTRDDFGNRMLGFAKLSTNGYSYLVEITKAR